jgi:PP-loop superfamily ATP-utilizing enzyme
MIEMFRKKKHIREISKYLDALLLDQVNLTIYASRFGWTEEIQNQITNTALLIRKYERRLRLIRM